MSFTRTQLIDAMFAVALDVETHAVALRKLTCDGSFLEGHTVRSADNLPPQEDVRALLVKMQAGVQKALNHIDGK